MPVNIAGEKKTDCCQIGLQSDPVPDPLNDDLGVDPKHWMYRNTVISFSKYGGRFTL